LDVRPNVPNSSFKVCGVATAIPLLRRWFLPTRESFSDGFVFTALDWVQAQVAASQTAVAMPIEASRATNGASLVTERVMPWAGSVVGMSARVSTAAGAGTCKVEVTVNGTAQTYGLLTIDAAQNARLTIDADRCRFVAGDRLGVKITTNGAWNGITSDLAATLFVLFEGVQP
jgi:hypothetical protein